MNKFPHLLPKSKRLLRYSFVVIGISLILIGVSFNWLRAWLMAVGDSYAADGHCCPCRIYADIIKHILIITGGFLAFSLLFKNHVIRFFEKFEYKPKTVLTVLLLLIFVALALVAYLPFSDYPYSMDEYNFFYQATIFSKGKLFLEVPEKFAPFKEQYMIFKNNRLFSKYPPGFPLLLTIGVLLNVPGLINPIIAIASLIVLYILADSLLGHKHALFCILLTATTPFFIAYSASYFSHPTALLLTSLIFVQLRKYELTSKKIYLIFLGFFSGYLTMTRPLDAFCVMIPTHLYLLYLLYKENNIKLFVYPTITFIILFALFLLYNYTLTGRISIATYPIVEGEFRIVDPSAKGFFQNAGSIASGYLENGLLYIPKLLSRYFLFPTGLFIPILAIFGVFKFKSKWKWVLICHFLLLIIFYNFHSGLGWPQYGARYYYPGFFSLAILAAFSFQYFFQVFDKEKSVVYTVTIVLLVNVSLSYLFIERYAYRFKIRLALSEDARGECSGKKIIVLSERSWNEQSRNCLRKASLFFVELRDIKRNFFLKGNELFIEDNELKGAVGGSLNKDALDKFLLNFPEYSLCFHSNSVFNKLVRYGD